MLRDTRVSPPEALPGEGVARVSVGVCEDKVQQIDLSVDDYAPQTPSRGRVAAAKLVTLTGGGVVVRSGPRVRGGEGKDAVGDRVLSELSSTIKASWGRQGQGRGRCRLGPWPLPSAPLASPLGP
jgi:hypothetical protein